MDVETQKQLMTAQALRQEASSFAQKITELEAEANEHQLVIDTIKDLDPQRKCFRLINDVLVEQTVGETLPTISGNMENMRTVIQTLKQKLQEKEKEADDIFKDVGQAGANLPAPQKQLLAEEMQAANNANM
uniref:Prefoldin subunit 2 n=1 Tax=Aplanochytrium stocchinoi TaxID=215587 RepID=A0A7S3LPW2_9STRA|mmetsp:Transcript_17578/g.21635  ORF Transcript_17578/g.21635 Transcript_17578/m.21635 type:complete len:132 (-) Transcript_17578:189-584(-)|eukprot:CAMPEP_0204830268 /NCGR_PEP_ID=MMETSP1346-20131115/8432_1 /ASSEMBLY_ACC=CAM_ASM_000771 /TAXON_ID=215587 /ORGANISM="Aplanochytrium stocchinoi, Strain GSBS06" /LENGTH=131 /DNA_ID=CAMNT_0051960431 /DNA_START=403 /DNA_END=798 /DNA_ORIENTATION=-